MKNWRLLKFNRLAMFFFIIVFTHGILSTASPIIHFSKLPKHFQLFPRNSNNEATIDIMGTVFSPGYSYISILLFRNNQQISYYKKTLHYSDNKAPFFFKPSIKAELAEYKIIVYTRINNDSSMVANVDSLVCGDVYIINGQSNSHPSSTNVTYKNEYCRTFGIQTGNSNYNPYNPADTFWTMSRGFYPFLSGIWGIKLQQLIKENCGIPTCIINGGTGGSGISEHLKDSLRPDYLYNTIYGKLYYRCLKAGVTGNIKAIIWYQGEGNATQSFSLYEDYFKSIYKSWKYDYPDFNKIFLLQINIGCKSNSLSGKFRDGQRKLSNKYPEIIPHATIGLPGFDGCHYDIIGYNRFALELFGIIDKEFYKSLSNANVDSPNMQKAYYSSSTQMEIVLEFQNDQHLKWPIDTLNKNLKNYFYLDGISGLVQRGSANGNILRLKLNNNSRATKITYLPNASINNTPIVPLLKNIRGISAFSFFEVPIEDPPLISNVKGCPAAFGAIKHIYGTNKSGTTGTSINRNTTWYRDTIYILHKFVRVTNNSTLTIQPGTIIMGSLAPLDTSVLIIHNESKIHAVGSQTDPIVFTSCNLQGTRKRGDWGGIVLCGSAPNNLGNNNELEGNFGAIHGGDNFDSNSGIMQFVRIEYPGAAVGENNELNGLTLASVGSGTTLKNIQVSFSNDDSFEWIGGTVNSKFLISWKPLDDDFDTDYGYSGYSQFGLGYRESNVADAFGSSGIESDNDSKSSNNFPKTSGIFSNYELWGPRLSSETPYNSFFKAAVHLKRNTELKIYNSLFIGWPTDTLKLQSSGLLIEGKSTTLNAIKDSIRLRNCITAAYPPNKRILNSSSSQSWAPYQNADNWYNFSEYKDSSVSNILLKEKKAPLKATPLFILNSPASRLNNGSSFYTQTKPPLPAFFQTVLYRGAFGGTDWTANWTEFNPQLVVYTAGLPSREAIDKDYESYFSYKLKNRNEPLVYPNPASNIFYVDPNIESSLNTEIILSDILGNVLYRRKFDKENEITPYEINVSNFSKGVYFIKISAWPDISIQKLIIQ